MTASDIRSMIAAGIAEAMKFQTAAAAPAVIEPPAKGKRTLSPEQKAKMAEGRKRAAAAKADAPATVVIDAPAKAAKPAKVRKAWEVNVRVAKKNGQPGVSVTVGPFSAWAYKGDEARMKDMLSAINGVFRNDDECKAMWTAVRNAFNGL
jgi:hypothetical protein